MRPFHYFALAIAATALSAATPLAADATDTSTLQVSQFYSSTTGKTARFACFVRKYDDAHLASHPHQNVRTMLLFAQREDVASDTATSLQIGVYFRGVKKRFDIDGSCYPDKEHPGSLTCGIDCDGGRFGLRQSVSDTVLIDIPTGVQASTDGPDGPQRSSEVNRKARFGSDDQTFRLERVDLKECASLDGNGDLKK